MSIEIEFRPHVGVYQDALKGPVEVTHPQDQVIAKTEHLPGGMHIGYLSHGSDKFNGLPNFTDLPEATRNDVLKAVTTKLGRPIKTYIADSRSWADIAAEHGEVEDDDDPEDATDALDDE